MPGWLLSGFFVINCMVLIIVVLLQSGKAADLAGAFGGAGSQTAFGPRGAANVLSQGHHLVRGDVHALRHGPGAAHRSRRGAGRLGAAKSFAASQAGASAESPSDHARAKLNPRDRRAISNLATSTANAASESACASPQKALTLRQTRAGFEAEIDSQINLATGSIAQKSRTNKGMTMEIVSRVYDSPFLHLMIAAINTTDLWLRKKWMQRSQR